MPRRTRHPAKTYIDGILAGNRVLLSQAITLVESRLPSDRELADEVLQACLPHSGNSFRVGITGVPGVGKSTFIDSFGSFLISETHHRLAVLAVDPSSRHTRGSILGDKTRMQQLSHHPDAYIRPTPTAGTLGGVAYKTREAMLLCEAAGYDWVFIETVGVGQSEILVGDMVDAFLLLMLPNAGDDLQGIKKGIMEMVDFLVINKADGPLELAAQKAARSYAHALHLFQAKPSGWISHVQTISALQRKGFELLVDKLAGFDDFIAQNGYKSRLRKEQLGVWFESLLQHSLWEDFLSYQNGLGQYEEMKHSVTLGQLLPSKAARDLIRAWYEHLVHIADS